MKTFQVNKTLSKFAETDVFVCTKKDAITIASFDVRILCYQNIIPYVKCLIIFSLFFWLLIGFRFCTWKQQMLECFWRYFLVLAGFMNLWYFLVIFPCVSRFYELMIFGSIPSAWNHGFLKIANWQENSWIFRVFGQDLGKFSWRNMPDFAKFFRILERNPRLSKILITKSRCQALGMPSVLSRLFHEI